MAKRKGLKSEARFFFLLVLSWSIREVCVPDVHNHNPLDE